MDTLVCADYQVLVVCLHISCAQGVFFLSYVLIYNFLFSNVQFLKFNKSVVSVFFFILSKNGFGSTIESDNGTKQEKINQERGRSWPAWGHEWYKHEDACPSVLSIQFTLDFQFFSPHNYLLFLW